MKKIIIISAFETYDVRINFFEKYYKTWSDHISILSSDYNHFTKKQKNNIRENEVQIKTPKYKKNISIARFYSHLMFSFKTYIYLRNNKYDLIHCIVPPNFLALFITRKKILKNTKIIIDIMDLWPETFPKKLPAKFISFIQKHRSRYLMKSDLVITECDLFSASIRKNGVNSNYIYLYKRDFVHNEFDISISNCIVLSYLGSINNIVDIETILSMLLLINKQKKTFLNIIGDGEQKQKLLFLLDKNQISYKDWGKIYDDDILKDILHKSHFGINIMKDTVHVGLTMKSIDYFSYGLPILNNIQYDTYFLIEKYGSGINISGVSLEESVDRITSLSDQDYKEYRKNVSIMFNDNFSKDIIVCKTNSIMDKILVLGE